MPNGKEVLHELDFEQRINTMPDRQLLEFVARQTFEMSNKFEGHKKRINNLESGAKKQSRIAGGISGTITSAIIAIINYFTSKG